MSDARKPKMREAAEDAPLPKLDVESQPKRAPDMPLSPEQSYLQRKAEVAQQDHEVFSEYLQEKIAREQQQKVQLAEPPPKAPTKVNRRSLLTWAAGTAVVGEAVTLGYPMVTGQSIPAQGLQHGGGTYTEAQRHPIDREFVNPKADVGGRNFGSWVLLMPTKLGGGTYAVNLETGRALAWIPYWNYGDYNPISHHLCAFPSADPAKGFEWINSTQGGKNALIYGIPTNIETPGEGFNIYRVRFDGAQMELMENVAETTGLGLGVHVTIDPKTAERYFVTDGQKDIAACFDRRTSRVIAAIKYDRVPNVRNLAEGWQKGGTLKISRIYPIRRPASTIISAPRARRSNGKWCRWASCSSKRGRSPATTSTVSAAPMAPSGIRPDVGRPPSCGCAVARSSSMPKRISSRLRFFSSTRMRQSIPDQEDRQRSLGGDIRQDLLARPRGRFLARGRFLCMMNNLRENNCSVFISSDPDPRNWKKIAHIEDPLWRGTSEPVPHGLFHGQLQALPLDPPPLSHQQRGHGRR